MQSVINTKGDFLMPRIQKWFSSVTIDKGNCFVPPTTHLYIYASQGDMVRIIDVYKDHCMPDNKGAIGSIVINIFLVILVKQTVGRQWASTGKMAYAIPSQAITRVKCPGCPTDICGMSLHTNRSGLYMRDKIGWRKMFSYFLYLD